MASEALAADLAKALVEAAEARRDLDRAEEALRWEKGVRADDEAAADKLLEEAREELASKDEEIGKLEERIEAVPTEDAVENAEAESRQVVDALRDYLADLGYPSDVHPSNVTCPMLRRLVEAAL